jgi:hypothetical protein
MRLENPEQIFFFSNTFKREEKLILMPNTP